MDQNHTDIVTTSEIFSRCWKITPRIGIPTGEVTVEKTVAGKRTTTEKVEILSTTAFSKFKQEARRLCLSVGTSFDRGFLVPENQIDTLTSKLTDIGHDFLAGVPAFIVEWNKAVTVRADEETDVEKKSKILAASSAKTAELANGLYFRVGKFKITPEDMGGELDDLAYEVQGLTGQIAQEIAEDVKTSWGGGATQRIRGTITRVKTKIEGLAFINPKFHELLITIEDVVKELPPSGKIEGKPYYLLMGLMEMLSSPTRILGDHKIEIPEDQKIDLITEVDNEIKTSFENNFSNGVQDLFLINDVDEDRKFSNSNYPVHAIEVPFEALIF